jgi:hypothetical protein
MSRFAILFSLCAVSTFGQYPGGAMPPPAGGATPPPGAYNPSMGGYHAGTGIAIGAGAAAGVGILYLVMHNRHRSEVVGCLQSANNVSETLRDDNGKDTYTLINSESVPLKAGERVALKGKKVSQSSGGRAFEVHGLIKNYGPCEP